MTASFEKSAYAEAFNGGYGVDDWSPPPPLEAGDFCVLTMVQLRDIDAGPEDASCHVFIYPSGSGNDFWRLLANSEDDSDAKCRAHCYSFD
jgi:hypothetical protein